MIVCPKLLCIGTKGAITMSITHNIDNNEYPLVSIIIPTYCRPHFFEQALQSALAQTYPNIEIFITDNSPDERTANLIYAKYGTDKRIHYEHHPELKTSLENWLVARKYNNPKAEYVQWLMDDDILLPHKISTMVDCYQKNPSVTLVTSYRKMINSEGLEMPDNIANRPIVNCNAILSGKEIGKSILTEMINFIGEPTTVLIKKKYLHNGDLGWTGKEGEALISDFPTWLNLCEQGDVIYLSKPASLWRIHGNNQQTSPDVIFQGLVCWSMMIRHAWKKRIFLERSEQLDCAVIRWLNESAYYFKKIPNNRTIEWNKELRKSFCSMSALLLEENDYSTYTNKSFINDEEG